MGGQLGPVTFLEMTRAQGEPRMSAHRVLQTRDAVGVWLESDDEIGGVGERSSHGPDARSDFEDALADVIPKQIEHMRAVAARLLHRLEIVGGVSLLRLTVPPVDVIRLSHVV
jgi:hypothetical protein